MTARVIGDFRLLSASNDIRLQSRKYLQKSNLIEISTSAVHKEQMEPQRTFNYIEIKK